MKVRASFAAVVAVVLLSGCASTKVIDREVLVREKLPRPERILVYDFAATPADVPEDSSLAGHYEPTTPPSAEDIKAGRQLGTEIAQELVAAIQGMGLPAVAGLVDTPPNVGDILIRGYLLSADPGSVAKRLVIGFGSGSSDLQTVVEGYQMTPHGMRKLGSGTIDASGGKGPGAAVPAAIAIATANPIGLIVTCGVKIYGDASGRSGLEGRAKATADEIAKELRKRFEQEGWIE